jgi:hypothetical protein
MISRRLPALLIFFISQTLQAGEFEPWFTGPLFATPGQTVPRGHVDVVLSGNTATIDALYDRRWGTVPTDTAKSVEFNSQFLYGLTDNLDLQYTMSYVQNQNRGSTYAHIGDTLLLLGYQAFTQDGKRPYLRITIQQIIPTGLYNNLSESRNGTNITGMGSNQTSFGLDFEYLSQLSATHYLNSTLNISYTHAMDVSVRGLNAYGGTSSTHGHIDPGDSVAIDLATEISITQQWVAVLEGIFIYQQAASFKGVIGTPTEDDLQPPGPRRNRLHKRLNHRLIPSKNNIGGTNGIGNGNLDQITLAPAIEYNFSDQYGVIAGVWFTVAGKNTPAFTSPMVTFNAYW